MHDPDCRSRPSCSRTLVRRPNGDQLPLDPDWGHPIDKPCAAGASSDVLDEPVGDAEPSVVDRLPRL